MGILSEEPEYFSGETDIWNNNDQIMEVLDTFPRLHEIEAFQCRNAGTNPVPLMVRFSRCFVFLSWARPDTCQSMMGAEMFGS